MGFFSKILGKKSPEQSSASQEDRDHGQEEQQFGPFPPNTARPEPSDRMCFVVLESEYKETGCLARTGLHLALKSADIGGMGKAYLLGQLWGWTLEELDEIRASGDNLLMALAPADERCGLVSSMQMAGIIKDFFEEQTKNLSVEEVAAVAEMTVEEAEEKGLREIQQLFTDVFGIRDSVFGSERFVNIAGDVHAGPCFFFDFKVKEGMEPLEPGSCIPFAEYEGINAIIKLEWE